MLTRQSTPITSPPAACSSLKKPEAPVPKWITGTPVARMRIDQRARIGLHEAHVIVGAERQLSKTYMHCAGGRLQAGEGGRTSTILPIRRRRPIFVRKSTFLPPPGPLHF